MAVRVDRADRVLAQVFAARHRNAELDRLDDRVDGRGEAREIDDGRRHRLGHRVQPHRDLGDDAQRSLGADEQPREVVAGRRLLRAARGADHLAVGGDDGQAEHVLLHRAVAHGVRARCAGGGHSAQARVRAGIDREEESGALQLVVQLHAGDACLHRCREIFGLHGEHAVHLREVDRHAPAHREQVPLERRADAVGDDRHAVCATQADDLGDVVGAVCENDGVGRRGRKRRLVAAVMVAHGGGGAEALAEARAQGRGERVGKRALQRVGNDRGAVHGISSKRSGPRPGRGAHRAGFSRKWYPEPRVSGLGLWRPSVGDTLA